MAVMALCAGCAVGEHSAHIYHWNRPGKGVLGGAYCTCKGECSPNQLIFLELLTDVLNCARKTLDEGEK